MYIIEIIRQRIRLTRVYIDRSGPRDWGDWHRERERERVVEKERWGSERERQMERNKRSWFRQTKTDRQTDHQSSRTPIVHVTSNSVLLYQCPSERKNIFL